ncbi:hypothetical protein QUA82_29200 [Microcoleus sp. F8-D3]
MPASLVEIPYPYPLKYLDRYPLKYLDRCLRRRLYGFTGRHLDRHLESDAQKQFQQKEAQAA